MRGLILYSGALAQVPRQGGLTWLHLQFLLGFRRLGYRVLFLDRLAPAMCIDGDGRPANVADSLNLRYFFQVMRDYSLEDSFSLSYNGGEQTFGVARSAVLELASEADVLVNVMGYFDDEEILGRVPRRVFLDIDPGFPQMWHALGLHDAFAGHNRFVTLGRNIGQATCPIPTCGLDWVPMPQPVVLEQWPLQPSRPAGAFTSIGAWRGPNGPIEYDGTTYGLRAHEFRKIIDLPARCPATRFEQALEIHPADERDIHRLQACGWNLVDPKAVAGGPRDYQAYLARSKAEILVPKQMYVQTACGLLSDRSAYYLATGRPVLARDTGLRDLYPAGEGLLTFETLDEAADGVAKINADYDRHCARAREIAVAEFDSDLALARMIDAVA